MVADASTKRKLQSALGCLIYVRDDFRLAQFAIHHVSREVANAPDKTLAKMKRLVRFLVGVKNQEVVMKVESDSKPIQVYCDSDWAGNVFTRKSVDCIVLKYQGCVIHMSTKQQAFIAQSSADAGLAGAHRAAAMGVAACNFLLEVWGEDVVGEIFTDSKAGLAVIQRVGCGQIRHLQIKQLCCQPLAGSGRLRFAK
eukprot:4129428-Amphidinium_carterae.1